MISLTAPEDHLALSNLSQTYLSLNDAKNALSTAETIISIKPTWSKGHFRKAKALLKLGQSNESLHTLKNCWKVETGDHNKAMIKKEIFQVI